MNIVRSSKQKKYNITAKIFDRRGVLICIGKNSYKKTHPFMAKHAKQFNVHKLFLHAEVDAILRCMRMRQIHRAYKLVVERYNADGSPGYCKPCEICDSVIRTMTNIKIVEHT